MARSSMVTRRTFLIAGIGGSAALLAAWWLRGTREPVSATGDLAPLTVLDVDAPAIIAAIVPAMLDGVLPATPPSARAAAVDETVVNVARAIGGLPPASQKELGELFSLLAFSPSRIVVAGVHSPWSEASAAEVAAFLDRWRTSRWSLLHSAYGALHQLIYAAWYANPKSWPAIGYAGPPQLG